MQTVDNDGVTLAYEEGGREAAEAETVVFVEGLGYGRWMWNWQVDALEEDYHLLLPDNRGTGDSDAPEGPYTIEEMAADLEAVLEDAGVEGVHVIGASMGGMIAQAYAIGYDRAETLSLLCSTPGGEDAVEATEETLAIMYATPEGADVRELIRYRMTPALSDGFAEAHEDLMEQIVDWRLEMDADDAARTAQATGVAMYDAGEQLGELSIPTLVLHGTEDRVLPVENARLLAERIPEAQLELFEGGPHLFFLEDAELVNDHLQAFLSDG